MKDLIYQINNMNLMMSLESFSDRVISKYFCSTSGMDESLSDFQEKKHSCTGPKTVSKGKVNSIKKRKQIKGQRDIRTLVKLRKNELVTYTKDFDQMCKSSGIDVDSEQLQLAIALSKSLHNSETELDVETVPNKPLSALERTKKIKSTLQEYGFKVPTCVLKKPSKRTVSNKKYKLLTTPDSEKNDIICSKYSEVLRRNHPTLNNIENTNCIIENTDNEIYNKSSNIPYNKIKNVKVFYIENNLIEKSSHKTCLLKDWSAIPGRPISPDLKASNFKFDEYDFTQDELDCILSNPLQLTQEIINKKILFDCGKESTQETFKDNIMNTQIDPLHINDSEKKQLHNSFEHPIDKNKNMDATQRTRSASPDLFEDDEYFLEEPTHSQNSVIKTNTSKIIKMSFMDITECVSSVSYKEQNIIPEVCVFPEISRKDFLGSNALQDEKEQLCTKKASLGGDAYCKKDNFRQSAQINNTLHFNIQSQTKLSSETITEIDDFMEETECVESGYNQRNMQNFELSLENNGNLQNKCLSKIFTSDIKLSENNYVQSERCSTPLYEDKNEDYSHEIIENIDLTQSMVESVDCIKEVNNYSSKDYIDDINIEQSNYNQVIEPVTINLTQSSNSNEELPIVQLSDTKESADDTIIIYDSDTSNNILVKDNVLDTDTTKEMIQSSTEETSYDKISLIKNCFSAKMPNDEDNINLVLSDNQEVKSNTSLDDNDDTIDLTQSPELSTQTYHSSESLGKQNNVSIDYDELCDMIATTSDSIRKKNDTIENESLAVSIDYDELCDMIATTSDSIRKKNGTIENELLSNNSDEQNLSCESAKSLLICSPERAKKNNTSVNNFLDEENINTISLSDSHLPNVEVKSICKNTEAHRKNGVSQSTPLKLTDLSNKSVVHTPPVNDEYIIKTDNVTPMLHYESMTTPARNKELEKYGLKPIKRKRAIQLLTYLYNQTHPVVEQCVLDEIPSTSKKPKIDEQATKKITTIHKQQEPTIEELDLNKENLYKETKEQPDIKAIYCSPDDWVFQTREKAKVHSCRVPLHIAFHNYVSCRSMLRAAILRYEPINIDVIHKDLIANGFRYNPKELLKFMDKKCITVKTADNKTRNQKI